MTDFPKTLEYKHSRSGRLDTPTTRVGQILGYIRHRLWRLEMDRDECLGLEDVAARDKVASSPAGRQGWEG